MINKTADLNPKLFDKGVEQVPKEIDAQLSGKVKFGLTHICMYASMTIL